MQFQTSTRGFNAGSSDGVFVDKVRIVDAEQTDERFGDLSLKLLLDIGKEWQPVMYIDGTFKKDDSGEVLGIGSVMKLLRFFERLGIQTTLSSDQPIPQDAINSLINREMYRLRYSTGINGEGKPTRKDWQEVWNGEDPNGAASLKQRFFTEVTRGYPKDYVTPTTQSTLPAILAPLEEDSF
jgi:hypothetical protein